MVNDEFDEDFYLSCNPDVAVAISGGLFASGLDHYVQYGQFESRAGSRGKSPPQRTSAAASDREILPSASVSEELAADSKFTLQPNYNGPETAETLDPLSLLAIRHGADKWGVHLYTPIYNRFLSSKRALPVRLLELGVGGYGAEHQGGASLRMWADYFPHGRIVGIDLFPKSLDLPSGVEVVQADQTDSAALIKMLEEQGPFDIVIDDASHRATETVETFSIIFPRLSRGALYIVEDLHCAFGAPYGGRVDGSGSIIQKLQSLIVDIHHREVTTFQPNYEASPWEHWWVGCMFF